MNKRGIWNVIILALSAVLILASPNRVFAETLFGCPKDEIVTTQAGECPVCGSPLSVVKEGYLSDAGRIVIDTFSEQEKKDLGIEKDYKMFIVIYSSPSGKKSFEPGRRMERKVVLFKYNCNGVFSTRLLSDECRFLGDAPGALEKERREDAEREAKLQKELEEKAEKERLRAAMNSELEESRPEFERQLSAQGLSVDEIETAWERHLTKIYRKYRYDPAIDDFKFIKTDETLEERAQRLEKEASLRESMRRELEESWPIFYRRLQSSGFSDKDIRLVWEDEKRKVYEKYNYDPETDSFGGIELLETGGGDEEN